MGVAYSDVPRGAGVAYFPAVSLSYCESCQLNFGATPFMYPFIGGAMFVGTKSPLGDKN